jgi:hypothetical protein
VTLLSGSYVPTVGSTERRQAPPKCSRLYGVTFQYIIIVIFTVVKNLKFHGNVSSGFIKDQIS